MAHHGRYPRRLSSRPFVVLERVDVEIFGGVSWISAEAMAKLKAVAVPAAPPPISGIPPFNGMRVEVVPWLPKWQVRPTRRQRRRKRWRERCEDLAYKNRLDRLIQTFEKAKVSP